MLEKLNLWKGKQERERERGVERSVQQKMLDWQLFKVRIQPLTQAHVYNCIAVAFAVVPCPQRRKNTCHVGLEPSGECLLCGKLG